MKLGILGGGQLARMMALASFPLNIRCKFLDPSPQACAGPLGELIQAPYDDNAALQQLAQDTDAVTFEFENVPASALETLADQVPTYPPAAALLTTQDRLVEKNLFHELGIRTAPFAEINSLEDFDQAIKQVGLPCILKTRRLGYDGKGQFVIHEAAQASEAWESVGKVASTLEGFVSFSREVSIIAVRHRSGDTRFYPLIENVHKDGILHLSTVMQNDALQSEAEAMIKILIDKLDYVGVLVLELFQVGKQLLANEFAPRVHNSGHWTIEGAFTSQFENHVRAVCGLPLGDTDAKGPTAMVNLIGELPDCEAILAIPGTSLHLYDTAPRPGRKIGHITVCASKDKDLQLRLGQVLNLVAP